MQESDYYAKIGKHYLEHSDYDGIELKITKTNTFNLSHVPPHQEEKLLHSWYHKIADNGKAQKPLDIVFKRKEGVLVIIYYVPRASEIYEIPIRVFIEEKYVRKAKSITKQRAQEIGKRIYV